MSLKRKKEYVERLEDMTQRKHGQGRDVMMRLVRNKLGMVGLVIVVLIVLSAIFATVLTRYDYSAQDLRNRFLFPSLEHLMGTDNYGRDIFARILYGGRVSLLVALISVAISTSIGAVLGAIAGYFGGVAETIIMRFMDILMAIPQLLMAVALSAALGTGLFNTALACAVGGIPAACRIVRATVMSIRDQEYIEAARACGMRNWRIIWIHIIPNTLAPLLVDTTLRIGQSITAIAGLSFVGLGIQPPTPEWGSILASSRTYMRDFYPLVLFPGLMIMLTLFGFNVFGDALRDALDPKLKQ